MFILVIILSKICLGNAGSILVIYSKENDDVREQLSEPLKWLGQGKEDACSIFKEDTPDQLFPIFSKIIFQQ